MYVSCLMQTLASLSSFILPTSPLISIFLLCLPLALPLHFFPLSPPSSFTGCHLNAVLMERAVKSVSSGPTVGLGGNHSTSSLPCHTSQTPRPLLHLFTPGSVTGLQSKMRHDYCPQRIPSLVGETDSTMVYMKSCRGEYRCGKTFACLFR